MLTDHRTSLYKAETLQVRLVTSTLENARPSRERKTGLVEHGNGGYSRNRRDGMQLCEGGGGEIDRFGREAGSQLTVMAES